MEAQHHYRRAEYEDKESRNLTRRDEKVEKKELHVSTISGVKTPKAYSASEQPTFDLRMFCISSVYNCFCFKVIIIFRCIPTPHFFLTVHPVLEKIII